MTAAVKLALFAAVLGGMFGGGVALGAAVGPFDADDPPPRMEHEQEHAP